MGAQRAVRGLVAAATQPAAKALAADGLGFPVTIDQEIGKGGAGDGVKQLATRRRLRQHCLGRARQRSRNRLPFTFHNGMGSWISPPYRSSSSTKLFSLFRAKKSSRGVDAKTTACERGNWDSLSSRPSRHRFCTHDPAIYQFRNMVHTIENAFLCHTSGKDRLPLLRFVLSSLCFPATGKAIVAGARASACEVVHTAT